MKKISDQAQAYAEPLNARYIKWTELHAKTIIANKFWIVEQDGTKVATLRKDEDNRFVMSNASGMKIYDNQDSLTQEFGKKFFTVKIVKESNSALPNEVHGYATSTSPHNAMFDIRKKTTSVY